MRARISILVLHAGRARGEKISSPIFTIGPLIGLEAKPESLAPRAESRIDPGNQARKPLSQITTGSIENDPMM
jgi:hypothetical protein